MERDITRSGDHTQSSSVETQALPRPIHPRLGGRIAEGRAAEDQIPPPDLIRPDASPEWRDLFKAVRRAVERLRE